MDYDRKGSFQGKKNSGHESQRAWRQDELIGGKQVTLTLRFTPKYADNRKKIALLTKPIYMKTIWIRTCRHQSQFLKIRQEVCHCC
jgi:hypothetical protein